MLISRELNLHIFSTLNSDEILSRSAADCVCAAHRVLLKRERRY